MSNTETSNTTPSAHNTPPQHPRRWRWLLLPSIALAFVGIASYGVQASWKGGHGCKHGQGMGGPGKMMMRAVHDLDLSKDQEEKLDQIKLDQRKAMRAKKDTRKSIHSEMMTILRAPSLDDAAIDSLMAQKSAQMQAMSSRHASMLKKVLHVLTPKQRTQLADKMDKMHERMGSRGHDDDDDKQEHDDD